MKGVLICGGTGSRLMPLTAITNKSLLPVYNKPLIHYPLQVLLDAGIQDVAIVTGTEHMDQMAEYLGASNFGCNFTFKVQKEPGGIAQALGLTKDFANGESICAILGDNVFFDDIRSAISAHTSGGHIFLKEVHDPERFGVATLDGDRVTHVEEKPITPQSNLAITGCYVYDNRCYDVIEHMQPSSRGELEITDITQWYLAQGELTATTLKDTWIDAGTFESLHAAATEVQKRL